MDEIPTRALLAFVRLGSARSVKIAFRVVLSGRYCVSCGIVGWNRVWCALQTLTKPNFIRNLRTKRKCDRRIPHQARFRPKGSHQAQKRPKQPAPSEISAGTPAKIAFRAGSSAGIGFGARYRPPRSRIPSEISAPSANATEESRTKRKCDRSGIAHGWGGYLNRASSALISCLTRGTGFGLGPGVCLSGEFSEAAV